jgi:hypothetical protein
MRNANLNFFFASGGQWALFEKTAPWTVKHPQKLLIKGVDISGKRLTD